MQGDNSLSLWQQRKSGFESGLSFTGRGRKPDSGWLRVFGWMSGNFLSFLRFAPFKFAIIGF
jgi:hypothetical protein